MGSNPHLNNNLQLELLTSFLGNCEATPALLCKLVSEATADNESFNVPFCEIGMKQKPWQEIQTCPFSALWIIALIVYYGV